VRNYEELMLLDTYVIAIVSLHYVIGEIICLRPLSDRG
jgi:hypothetical protein